MATLMCIRPTVDEVNFNDPEQRFIVCKTVGVNAGGRRYEMGDELPREALDGTRYGAARALQEIYDTPARLIETREYAMQDEALLAAMLRRADVGESAEPAVAVPDLVKDKPRPRKGNNRNQ